MTASLEGGEWSAARPGRPLPPGKTRYPFYRSLGGPQGRSWRAENLVPTGIRPWTVQPAVSRYTDWATRPTHYQHNIQILSGYHQHTIKMPQTEPARYHPDTRLKWIQTSSDAVPSSITLSSEYTAHPLEVCKVDPKSHTLLAICRTIAGPM